MDEITTLQAAIMKALAHPRRLAILAELAHGPRDVGGLAAVIGASQPATSQHLSAMRATGIIESARVGRETHYRLVDPEVTVACHIMRGVLERRLTRLASLSGQAPTEVPAP